MDTWIQVTCPKCKGDGTRPEDDWYRHPNDFRVVPCDICRAHGFLLAKPAEELKPISQDYLVRE